MDIFANYPLDFQIWVENISKTIWYLHNIFAKIFISNLSNQFAGSRDKNGS